jgi:2-haloacid dehalogenase
VFVVFDVNGTLTDPAGIGERWGAPDLGDAVLGTAIQSAMVDALLGEYRDFSEHIASALRLEVASRSLDPRPIQASLERAKQLDPFPDAPAALDRLRDGGHRLAVLTNSGARGGRATLDAAGLADRFEQILGVDAVRTFKPHPATYSYALEALGASPENAFLVAAHAFDVTGAKHAGMRAAWISRHEHAYPDSGIAPEIESPTLREAAEAIVAWAA